VAGGKGSSSSPAIHGKKVACPRGEAGGAKKKGDAKGGRLTKGRPTAKKKRKKNGNSRKKK